VESWWQSWEGHPWDTVSLSPWHRFISVAGEVDAEDPPGQIPLAGEIVCVAALARSPDGRQLDLWATANDGRVYTAFYNDAEGVWRGWFQVAEAIPQAGPPVPPPRDECAEIAASIPRLEAEVTRLEERIEQLDDPSDPRVTAPLRAQLLVVRAQIASRRDRAAVLGCT
jgi:hypothetical protein